MVNTTRVKKLKSALLSSAWTAGFALSAASVFAHDFWIEPAEFRPAAGSEVPITLRVGEDFNGTSQPLIPNWFSDYSATGPGGKQLVRGMIGDDPAGIITALDEGSQVIGYRSSRAFVEIEPATFNDYLEKEGLDWVIEWRKQNNQSEQTAREYYSRCAKALLRSRDATSGEGFDADLGYRLEIVPKRDPYALGQARRLPLQINYEGKPIANLLLVAFTAEEPLQKQRLRSNKAGMVDIDIDRSGTWLVKTVHIIEVDESDDKADWESFWASLTFRVELESIASETAHGQPIVTAN